MMKLIAASLSALVLSACSQPYDQDAYDEGYEQGYDNALYTVCREANQINPSIKERLQACRGY